MTTQFQVCKSNQEYLINCVNEIKTLLQNHLAKKNNKYQQNTNIVIPTWSGEESPALETICKLFELTKFERSLIILCAGIEIDKEISALCAELHGNSNKNYPTFELALAILPEPEWNVLSPARPLRNFKLIEMHDSTLSTLTNPLRIDERILHYLTGISYIDKRLDGIVRPIQTEAEIVDSHMYHVNQILLALQNTSDEFPLIQLWGKDTASKKIISTHVCKSMGLGLLQLPAEFIPTKPDEINAFVQICMRESNLLGSAIYVSVEDNEPALITAVKRFTESIDSTIFLDTYGRWSNFERKSISLEIKKPKKSEQHNLWKSCLGKVANNINNEIAELANQFDLDAHTIQTVSTEVLLTTKDITRLPKSLWESTRSITRTKIAELAQQITSSVTMDDLVLPEQQKQLLCDIILHIKHRSQVYEEWGFEKMSSRGLGTTVLFSGASGTGKTMAAEVLANELNLDLFRVDYSEIMSKYVGDSEKKLRDLYDAAESGGPIIFIDEGDAMIGKRSNNVQNSSDHWARLQVSYILQKMESFRGITIFATNMKNTIDSAAMRRFRFSVNFTFPDENSRAEIWKKVFPRETPTSGLDIRRLAKLNVTGGQIWNIATNACFYAVQDGMSVNMQHIKQATRDEFVKLELPLSNIELVDW